MSENRTTRCTLCGKEPEDPKEIIHLPLYVIGSEGIEACLSCRIALSEVARGLMLAASVGRKEGYKAAKSVAEAKAAQPADAG